MNPRRLPLEAWRERAWTPAATYFHTPEWFSAWHRWTGDAVFAVEWPGLGWMPVAVKGRRAMSAPPGVYGGPVPALGASPSRLWAAVQRWLRREGLRLETLCLRPPPAPAVPWTTYVAVLPSAPSRIPFQWRFNFRNYWRRTYRNGVTVGPLTPDNLNDYLTLYDVNYRRWDEKRMRYAPRFFEALLRSRGAAAKIAYWEGRPVAGIIAFAHPHSMFHWHALAHPDHRKSWAWYRLHYEMMAEAVRRGIHRYDMLPAPTRRAERIGFHKKGFGARPVTVWWVEGLR